MCSLVEDSVSSHKHLNRVMYVVGLGVVVVWRMRLSVRRRHCMWRIGGSNVMDGVGDVVAMILSHDDTYQDCNGSTVDPGSHQEIASTSIELSHKVMLS